MGLVFLAFSQGLNAKNGTAHALDLMFNENRLGQAELQAQTQIKIPELITPNGDGKNDTWRIEGIENFKKTKVMVFNRWGNKVYEMDQYDNSWSGKANRSVVVGDNKLSSGTYYYIVELDDKLFKGYLFIAR